MGLVVEVSTMVLSQHQEHLSLHLDSNFKN